MKKLKSNELRQQLIDELELEKVKIFEIYNKNKSDLKKEKKILKEKLIQLEMIKVYLISNKPEYDQRLLSLLGKGHYSYYNDKYLQLRDELIDLNTKYNEEEDLTKKEVKKYEDLIDIKKEDLEEVLTYSNDEVKSNNEFINDYDNAVTEYKIKKKEYGKRCNKVNSMEKDNAKVYKKINKLDKRITKLSK